MSLTTKLRQYLLVIACITAGLTVSAPPVFAGKLQDARESVESGKSSAASSSSDSAPTSSRNRPEDSLLVPVALFLTAALWLPPYISWHMDVGYHDYPYDRGEPGYLVMKPGPNPLFERKRRDPPKGEGNSDPSSEPKAEVILPEKSWSLRMQAESGRESDDLSWVNAQISVEWYHTGFWIRQLEFRETLESGNDRLVLQDSGILFDYLLTPRLNVAVGFGVFGIKDLDAKRSLATKIKVDIFPVQPVHYGFDYSHSEIPDTATVRTLQHTLGFNWRNYQPFVSYQKTEIGGTKISGRGFGFRLWL